MVHFLAISPQINFLIPKLITSPAPSSNPNSTNRNPNLNPINPTNLWETLSMKHMLEGMRLKLATNVLAHIFDAYDL